MKSRLLLFACASALCATALLAGRAAPLPRRLRGRRRRHRRAGAPRAPDRPSEGRRVGASEDHDVLARRPGVLRPGPDVAAPLFLHRRDAVLPPGAAFRSGVRDVLDGPGARRAGPREPGVDGRGDRQSGGSRAESLGEGADVHRSPRPADRGAGRPALGGGGEARGVQEGARQGARRVPRGRGALDPPRQRRRGGAVGPRPVRPRRPPSPSTRRRSSAPPDTSPPTTISSTPSRTRPTMPRPPSTERSMRPRAPASRTRSTCTATCCPASDAGRKRSRSSRKPTRSRWPTRRPRT